MEGCSHSRESGCRYIYYTAYDPIRLGTDKRGDDCIEENGAKIWRVRRDNTGESELIFDSEARLFFHDYQVSGDYLYLYHKHLMDSGKNVWFQVSNAVMRVNFRENTMKWMNFIAE